MIRLGLLLLAVALANEACTRRQYPFVESGVVRNGFRGHGAKYNDTIGFSPDGKAVAYLWSEGRYGPPLPADERPRPRTLRESIHLRSFEVGAPLAERSVLLESADLGAQGEPGFNLEASVFFSPDSRYLAAVSPGQLIVVDRVSGSRRSLGPPGAHFGGFRWRSPRQLAYSTHADGQLNFRVVDLDGPDAVGRPVFREEGWAVPSRDRLAFNAWSPSGRHVILGSVIVDLDTGAKRPGGEALFYFHTWERTGRRLFFHDTSGPGGGSKTALFDLDAGRTVDLSQAMRKTLGDTTAVSVDSWTVDGRHVILRDSGFDKSLLLLVEPLEVVLDVKGILFWSPVPGWLVLRSAGDRLEWIDFSGRRGGPIVGWPPQWTWAPDGRYAAEVRDEKLVVLDVSPPAPKSP